MMAVERIRDGEHPSDVIAAYGFNRTTIYKWLNALSKSAAGMEGLRSRAATGRPPTLTSAQEQQVFRWVNGRDPHQYGLEYIVSTKGKQTLRFLPNYAPDLNPDEAVWSHVNRTGIARRPLRKGEKLKDKIDEQLQMLKRTPKLVRSFFLAPSVAYIRDC